MVGCPEQPGSTLYERIESENEMNETVIHNTAEDMDTEHEFDHYLSTTDSKSVHASSSLLSEASGSGAKV